MGALVKQRQEGIKFQRIGYTRRLFLVIGHGGVFGQSEGRIGKCAWDFQTAHEAVPEDDMESYGYGCLFTIPGLEAGCW